ncbi:MAG: hypothetical protein OEY86_18985 [Nitrospira sp.]|nr:hypothetical protein [Nitrospira sp.]
MKEGLLLLAPSAVRDGKSISLREHGGINYFGPHANGFSGRNWEQIEYEEGMVVLLCSFGRRGNADLHQSSRSKLVE